MAHLLVVLEKWFPLQGEQAHSLYFSSSLALPSSLLSCHFFLFIFSLLLGLSHSIFQVCKALQEECDLWQILSFLIKLSC